MKFTHCLALTGVAPVGAVAASGFPWRIGLSASEVVVSPPGDLLVPTADMVLDRGVRVDASPEIARRVIEQAFEDEEASRILAREENSCLIPNVPIPGFEDEGRTGTVVFALLLLAPKRTLPHLRKWYVAALEAPSVALGMRLAVESFTVMRMLRDIKRAALML